ncbi:hypothetical protein P9847_18590 [Paenibacillus chibensis]|uniref:Uncharacterized protein n=1 Tax=Paenibacillus chibensis TaxID=59846 RepID=A0ABU6PWT6_9BACL|nr:hypothetical protein [Paenibacillus chibensis]
MGHYFYITPEEYAAAEKVGIGKATLESRVWDLGWEKDRALTTPPRKLTDRSRWSKVAEKNGISYKTFLNRIVLHGWTDERAATEPVWSKEDYRRNWVKNNPRNNRCEDPLFQLSELALKNGICKSTFYSRVRKLRWDPKRAATEPIVPPQECGRRGIQAIRQIKGDINAPFFKRINPKCSVR